MPEPGTAADQINDRQGDGHDGKRVQPAKRPIIRTGNFKHAQRQEDYRRADDQNRDPSPSSELLAPSFEPRPVVPAQPKEKGDEKRNKPAVAVLFVEAPFF